MVSNMSEFEDLIPNPSLETLRAKAGKLPLLPGVYLMKDKENKIIYIGKAKALKNRVTSYFHGFDKHTTKTYRMVTLVRDFDYIVTASESEALVLECSLIKQYTPKYNILLKDDRGFHFVQITPPPWSRISVAHRINKENGEFIGPFPSSDLLRRMVEEAQTIFMLPTCNRQFPKDIGKERPCLNYFIKKCYAPCRYGVGNEASHADRIAQAIDFILEGDEKTVEKMTAQMESCAEQLDFERAARLRDTITAIKRMSEKQNVVSLGVKEADVIALARGGDSCCFAVLKLRDHKLTGKDHYIIDDRLEENADAAELRSEFILGYYADRLEIPKMILLDGPTADSALLAGFLTDKLGSKVKITVPQRGENCDLVKMSLENAKENLLLHEDKGREYRMVTELSRLVGLPSPADYIEAYDISNTSGSDNVGGMVAFRRGKPFKGAYRQFVIKSFEGQDDYGSMREVALRRFNRYLEALQKDAPAEGFGMRPDLILVDGGAGQASAFYSVLADLGLNDIPLLGMVKDGHHHTRALVTPEGLEIEIKKDRGAFTLVSTIQEEVHRYTVGYHRARRSNRNLHSVMAQVNGIGPKRVQILMEHFKTFGKIKKATVEELAAVKGMSESAAQSLRRFLDEEYGGC